MDRGDSCPPAGAGRGGHAPRHARATDLAAFQPADLQETLESAGGGRICPLSHLHGSLQRPQPSAYCKRGCGVSFGGLGCWDF